MRIGSSDGFEEWSSGGLGDNFKLMVVIFERVDLNHSDHVGIVEGMMSTFFLYFFMSLYFG